MGKYLIFHLCKSEELKNDVFIILVFKIIKCTSHTCNVLRTIIIVYANKNIILEITKKLWKKFAILCNDYYIIKYRK